MRVTARPEAECVPVWVNSGEELPVLAIMFIPSGGPKLLLWSQNQGCTGLFPVNAFEVVDPTVPTEWSAAISENGQFELSPAEWQTSGFWERYHDEDPQAVETFQRCMHAIADGS